MGFIKLNLRNEDLRRRAGIWRPKHGAPRGVIYIAGKRRYLSHVVIERAGIERKPKHVVEHINGDTLDDRLENLRVVPYSINSYNCRSKGAVMRGVCKTVNSRGRPYAAYISVSGKTQYLGSFPTAEDAHAAWCHASLEQRGFLPHALAE